MVDPALPAPRNDAPLPAGPPRNAGRPYRPMAIGFLLLALPLFVAAFLAEDGAGRAANLASGVVLVALGLLLDRTGRR